MEQQQEQEQGTGTGTKEGGTGAMCLMLAVTVKRGAPRHTTPHHTVPCLAMPCHTKGPGDWACLAVHSLHVSHLNGSSAPKQASRQTAEILASEQTDGAVA